jgi:hypothetical protein
LPIGTSELKVASRKMGMDVSPQIIRAAPIQTNVRHKRRCFAAPKFGVYIFNQGVTLYMAADTLSARKPINSGPSAGSECIASADLQISGAPGAAHRNPPVAIVEHRVLIDRRARRPSAAVSVETFQAFLP